MKKLLIIIFTLLITLTSTIASTESSCYGFINRLIVPDVQAVLYLEKCNFKEEKSCVTTIMYDNFNECSGSGEESQCTEMGGDSYYKVKLIKKSKRLKIVKVFGVYSDKKLKYEGYGMTNSEKFFFKKKLSFRYKGKSGLSMRHHLRRIRMECE